MNIRQKSRNITQFQTTSSNKTRIQSPVLLRWWGGPSDFPWSTSSEPSPKGPGPLGWAQRAGPFGPGPKGQAQRPWQPPPGPIFGMGQMIIWGRSPPRRLACLGGGMVALRRAWLVACARPRVIIFVSIRSTQVILAWPPVSFEVGSERQGCRWMCKR